MSCQHNFVFRQSRVVDLAPKVETYGTKIKIVVYDRLDCLTCEISKAQQTLLCEGEAIPPFALDFEKEINK